MPRNVVVLVVSNITSVKFVFGLHVIYKYIPYLVK